MVDEGEADGAEGRCCTGPGAGASSKSIRVSHCERHGLHSESWVAAPEHMTVMGAEAGKQA
jgi:hypothetical protein